VSARRIFQPISKDKSASGKKFRASGLLIGLGLGAVALLSATAGAILAVSLASTPLKQSQLSVEEAAVFNEEQTISYKNLNLPQLDRPVNILVLGTKVLTSDLDEKERPKEDPGYHALVNSFKGLSDTMLLLRFDPQKDKLTVLSIPRDTQARIKEHGLRKINEANYYGGPALSAETISELLGGVPIDRYIRVNVQGVEKLLDALGGVTLYVPKDMKYQDDSQHLYINLKKGEQHLDGEKAVQFLRFRYDAYGDISRVQRQQIFMRALIEQTLKPQTLLKISDILSVVQSNIDTNLTVEELVALSSFAGQTERSNVNMLMLPGGFSGDGRNEVSYWLPNQSRIEQMAVQHFDYTPDDYQEADATETNDEDLSSVSIAIQDSTDNPEAVQALVRRLQQEGYSQIYVSDRWQEPLKVSRIVAQMGDDGSAAAVRAKLGFGEVLVESTGAIASDITIQLGEDWQELQNSTVRHDNTEETNREVQLH
jgi:polyisoprenyl-teichoic acid--peptidoglycan teichoic acid transferase